MMTTQFIREQLGLSQEALAQYLTISISQLAMHETGKRELPSGTMVKLADIIVFLKQNQKTSKQDNELLPKQKAKMQELLEKQIIALELKKIKEQRKIDAIVKKYEQSCKLNLFVDYLEKNKSTQIASMRLQAQSGIEKNNLVVQTMQTLKLEAITSEQVFLKSLKEK